MGGGAAGARGGAAMEEVSARFVAQKISKARWRPLPAAALQPPDIFATGSWDNEVSGRGGPGGVPEGVTPRGGPAGALMRCVPRAGQPAGAVGRGGARQRRVPGRASAALRHRARWGCDGHAGNTAPLSLLTLYQ